MVGSDLDLNLDQFSGRHDLTATRHFEIVVGVDYIVRINVNGQCALRVRLEKGCVFDIRNDLADWSMKT